MKSSSLMITDMKSQVFFLLILFIGVISGDEFVGGFQSIDESRAYPVFERFMRSNQHEWNGNWTIQRADEQVVNGINYHLEVINEDSGELRDVYLFYQPWNHTLYGRYDIKERDAEASYAFSSY